MAERPLNVKVIVAAVFAVAISAGYLVWWAVGDPTGSGIPAEWLMRPTGGIGILAASIGLLCCAMGYRVAAAVFGALAATDGLIALSRWAFFHNVPWPAGTDEPPSILGGTALVLLGGGIVLLGVRKSPSVRQTILAASFIVSSVAWFNVVLDVAPLANVTARNVGDISVVSSSLLMLVALAGIVIDRSSGWAQVTASGRPAARLSVGLLALITGLMLTLAATLRVLFSASPSDIFVLEVVLAVLMGVLGFAIVQLSRIVDQADLLLAAANDRLEKQVAERTLELRAANDDIRNFIELASHDLQAPLRTISGFSYILLRSEDSRFMDEHGDQLELISQAADKMQVIIKDLLAFTELRPETSPSQTPLGELYQTVIEPLEPRIAEIGATVKLTGPSTLPVVGSRWQLELMLRHLIENSLIHRSADRPPAIIVSGRAIGETVEIGVEDNGKGIDPRLQERMLQPFKTGTASERIGMGLAVSARIASNHFGNLRIISDGVSGTAVFVTLRGARSYRQANDHQSD